MRTLVILLTLMTAGCTRAPDVPAAPDLTSVERSIREAIERARAELESARSSAEAWGHYAMTLDAHEFVDDALTAYDVAATLDPDDLRWAYLPAVLLAPNDPTAALARFESAAQLRGDYAPLHVWRGRALEALGRSEDAEQALRRALGLDPGLGAAHALLGRILLDRGAEDEALGHFERALRADPANRMALSAMADLANRRGESESARLLAQRAQAAPVNSPMSDPVAGEVQKRSVGTTAVIARALMLESSGRRQDGADALLTLLQNDPDNVPVRVTLGQMLVRNGQFADGLAQLDDAVRRKPGLVSARMALADALRIAGDVERAADEYRRVIERDATAGHAHAGLAASLARLGRYDEAIDRFRTALEWIPNDVSTRYAYGRVLVWAQRHDEAAATFEQLAALEELNDSQRAELHLLRGQSLSELGRDADALRALDEARTLAPEMQGLVSGRARILDRLGRPGEAIATLRDELSGASTLEATVQLAWMLCTHPRHDLRDGAEAVALAEQAAQLVRRQDPLVLDVLACAYAEVGRFEDARAAVDEARALAELTGQSQVIPVLRAHRDRIIAGEPWRQSGDDPPPGG